MAQHGADKCDTVQCEVDVVLRLGVESQQNCTLMSITYHQQSLAIEMLLLARLHVMFEDRIKGC